MGRGRGSNRWQFSHFLQTGFIYFSEGGSEYETVHHQVASVVPKPLDSLIRFATDMEIDKFVTSWTNQLTVSEGNPTNEEN